MASGAERLNDLLRATRSWRLEWDVDELLLRIVREAVAWLHAQRGIIFLLEENSLKARATWPQPAAGASQALLHSTTKLAQQVVDTGRSLFAQYPDHSSHRRAPLRGVSCVPLTSSRGILGALQLESISAAGGLSRKDEEFIELLGLQGAAALEHAILYQSAITDPLTGLFTHRHFQQEVEQALRRALRTEQPLTLIVMDLDHFKKLNDTRGHAAGNRCLTQVAGSLRRTLRSTDTLARFGGDEFEILLPDTSAPAALNVAQKLRQSIAQLKLGVTATMGLAAFPKNASNAQDLFLQADGALYQAKAGGRNCVQVSGREEKDALAAKALRGKSPVAQLPQSKRQRTGQKQLSLHRKLSVRESVDGHLVLKRLGLGSTGEVLLVRQPDLDREVALKRPHTPYLSTAQVQAFENEAKLTGKLEHPGVIAIHTMGRDADGRRYYTMKPLRGHSLREILEARHENQSGFAEEFTLNRLLEVLHRVSETIAYAHGQGIVHLDLTPANIMVGNYGEVTVIDWASGTSSSGRRPLKVPRRQRTGLKYVRGSPHYLAPEQLSDNAQAGPAADVFALGAILYQILCGAAPFTRDSTRQMLAALIKGELTPPENVAPNLAIDAVISSLCMEALSRDCALRPTAQAFAARLGRYVRNEIEWVVTRFDSQHRLAAEEWTVAQGQWKLVKGEWVSLDQRDNKLFWKQPAPDGFRLICEGWVEGKGELSLLGRAPDADERDCNPGYGVLFQFGGEGLFAKLTHGQGGLFKNGWIPQPGRKYRLELQYFDGWLYCSVDGQRLFTYREPFRYPGSLLGLYAWGPGAHFRPLEIHRQPWQLQTSALRVADQRFQRGHYDEALREYQSIAAAIPRRLEGLEARLKAGICLVRLSRFVEADSVFTQLRGTILEPYALIEMAHRNLFSPKPNVSRAVRLYKELFVKFPDSQARKSVSSLLPQVHRGLFKTLRQYLSVRFELEQIAQAYYADINPPPTNAAYAASSQLRSLTCLGLYKQALDAAVRFRNRLTPERCVVGEFQPIFWAAALASGRDDLLDDPPIELAVVTREWLTDPLVGALARRGRLARFLQHVRRHGHRWMHAAPRRFALNMLGVHLALKRSDSLNWYLQHVQSRITPQQQSWNLLLGATLATARRPELLERFLHTLQGWPQHDWARQLSTALQAQSALEAGDLTAAAQSLSAIDQPLSDNYYCLLQLLLGSLGLLQRPSLADLAPYVDTHLAGTQLDLALMFLGKKPPTPGKLWPHPLWCPELRLWLGLWLEAKGHRTKARRVVEPARDPRYGWTYSQPALELLLKRLS